MKKTLALHIFIVICFSLGVLAQEETPKYNFNVGGGVSFPQSSTGNFANSGGNFEVGGGPNLGKDLGFNAEFMWNGLPPKQSVIAATGAPGGNARLYSVTGNAILHTHEGHRFGLYGIGGIGWYHRSWELTAPTLSVGTICLPSYAFWGVVCSNGLVSTTTTLRSGSDNGFGWNVGGGVTYRLKSHLKFYTEARFHFAYFNDVNTKIIPLTFGLRW